MNLSERRAQLRASRPAPVAPKAKRIRLPYYERFHSGAMRRVARSIMRKSDAGAARLRQIVEDRAAGLSLRECGERAGGISKERVRQILIWEARGSEAE